MSEPIDTAAVDPEEFARQVRTISDEDLEALMASDVRPAALEEIFKRMVRHFQADRAGDLDAVVHWKIFDRPGGGYDHYELVIADGSCSLSELPGQDPDVTFRARPVDFLKLITGNANPMRLALRGKLQVVGDLGLARKVGGLFEIPKG